MINGTRYRLTQEVNRQTQLAKDIARGQSDISSQTRLQAPSDDPAASARVAQIRQTQANQKVWTANIDAAASLAAQVDTAMGGVGSLVDRARELTLSASSGTLNASDRATIATELRGIVADIQSQSAEVDSRGYALFPTGGALRIPIAPNLALAATTSKEAVFQGIQTPGGPMDLTAIISAAADAIELPLSADRDPAVQASLAAIEAASDHVSAIRGEQGARAARIDAVKERLASGALLLDEERGTLEGTDIQKTVAEVNAKQLALDAAQAVFARVNKSTLFDLLG